METKHSIYGPDDQIGMLNEIQPTKLVQAAQLVTSGQIYDLSHVLDEHVPAFPGRTFTQSLRTTAHQINKRRPDAGELGGMGANNMNWIIDIVNGTSQMGTHLDGLNHIQSGDRFYNGHTLDDLVENYGTNKLGMETVPQIVTRGILLDIAGLKGVEQLDKGYVITVADVEAAMLRQGVSISPGDALLFHTGWGRYWMVDNETYLSGEPGPGTAVAKWMVKQKVALSGCDTWSYGPVPAEDVERPFVVPQILNVAHGLFIVENLFLAELANAQVYTFMFVLTHAKVRGATGAWVAPVAIV
jgi:kynurenine formamidase